MKLNELLAVMPQLDVKGKRDIEITGITFDSRTVRQGYLFAALPGAVCDGHDYIDEAVERGAVAVLAQKEISSSKVTLIIAEDSRLALACLSDNFYGSPSKEIEVVGVTGTNGKTTVCYLVREILKAAGRKPALLGTVEYLIGERSIPAERTTPEAPYLQSMMREAVKEGCDSLVMEVSSHSLEQDRVAYVDFDIGVFTNLGRDHLDFHGSCDNYFGSKTALFRVPSLKLAVINCDDPWGQKLASMTEVPVTAYGMGDAAALRGLAVETGPHGSSFEMDIEPRRVKVALPLLGRHNIYNALAASGVALSMGVDAETIASALAAARPGPGRLEEIKCDQPYRVFIDYAHTEEALGCAINAVREGCKGKVILVFGCGGDRDTTKRAPMGRVAARLADVSIITSDNPRREDPLKIMAEIAGGFEGTKKRYSSIPDRREAIAAALAEAEKGDVVLVAGKGHERTQEFGSTIVPFSDRDVVKELLQRQ